MESHANRIRRLTSPPGQDNVDSDGIMECMEYLANNIVTFKSSCHTFAAQSVSSSITRTIKDIVIEWSAVEENKRQRKRRKQKRAKLARLQLIPIQCTIFLNGLPRPKIFFSGTTSTDLKGVSKYAVVYPVKEFLHVVDTVEGCTLPGVFLLVPRAKMTKRYNDMKSYHDLIKALEYTTSIKCTNPRSSVNREVVFEGGNRNYVNLGTKALRNSRGLVSDLKGLCDRPDHLKQIASLQSTMEHAAIEYIDSESLLCIKNTKQMSGYPGFPLRDGRDSHIWPTMAIAQNIFLQAHTDIDYFTSATTTLHASEGGLNMNDEVCNYFCFPRHGLAISIRNGDLLLFNPLELHCVSSRCNAELVYYNVSLYLKTSVVGGNDNSRII